MGDVLAALTTLGDKLAAHVVLAACAIALGILVALPLAVWASRNAAIARLSLGFASLVQTVPALALLALFFPILLSLRAVSAKASHARLPAALLALRSMPCCSLRNAVTAREHMAPGVLEAADGVGMTGWQKLRLVEARSPPYVMAGITAAVWTIGAATLSTTIGQPSLGDPIFAGLQTQNWTLVLAGCLASAGLALVADALLGLVERGFAQGKRLFVWSGIGIALLGIAASAWVLLGAALFGGSQDDDSVTIGAKGFSEQYILARLIGQRLESEGFSVSYRDGLGSAVAHSAVASGEIDVLVDYTGTIWANQMNRTDNPDRDTMLREIAAWETETSGVEVLGRLGFENAYGLALRSDLAEARGIASIADLAGASRQMTIGGDPEFFERPEWIAVRDTYGLQFAATRNFSPTFMYNALQSGEADVIGAYTSDGRIAADDLTILDDPSGAFPNYDAIILLSPEAKTDPALVEAISPLVGAIDVEAMRAANLSVDRIDAQKRTPAEAARELARNLDPAPQP